VIDEALKNQNACCPGAAATAIQAGKHLGATVAESITYATSYDRSPGDSFVGYVGCILTVGTEKWNRGGYPRRLSIPLLRS
jgi:AmmeMemoRadiSam system protein B